MRGRHVAMLMHHHHHHHYQAIVFDNVLTETRVHTIFHIKFLVC